MGRRLADPVRSGGAVHWTAKSACTTFEYMSHARATDRVPEGLREERTALSVLLASPALATLVTWFHQHPESTPYVRELLRATGLGIRSLQTEIARLEDLGVLRRVPDGRLVRYLLVAESPRWQALSPLVVACGHGVGAEKAGWGHVQDHSRWDHRVLDERNRLLSVAVAEHVRRDSQHIATALQVLRRRLAGDVGPSRWSLEQWVVLLEEAQRSENGRAALFAVLEGQTEWATRMRQSTPFAGVLSDDERAAILAAAPTSLAVLP